MKKSTGNQIFLAAFTLVIFFGCFSISLISSAAAGTEPAQFNVNTSIADNLTALKGKIVTVYLTSGQTITGTVNEVKGNLLHFIKLSQKDFFDALVSIDHISAIDTKVRGQ